MPEQIAADKLPAGKRKQDKHACSTSCGNLKLNVKQQWGFFTIYRHLMLTKDRHSVKATDYI